MDSHLQTGHMGFEDSHHGKFPAFLERFSWKWDNLCLNLTSGVLMIGTWFQY